MAKLAYVLFFILLVSISSNEIIDLLRCIYRNFVPHIQLVVELIDAIKIQKWMDVVVKASEIYTELKKVIDTCKASSAPSLF